jgi:acyl-CoA thioester hydrolase
MISLTPELESILSPYPVITRVPVQWAQLDANQHINNVVYLQWVEAGRVDYFEQIHMIDINDNPHTVGPILASAECKYIYPLTFPDVVMIGTRCTQIREDRFVLETAIATERHNRLAAINSAVVVTLDYQTRQKSPVPESLRSAILEVESRAGA